MIDYKNPDYLPIIKERAERLQKIRKDKKLLIAAKVYYKHNPVQFINDWLFTYDPRKTPSTIPFILWPKQEEYILWLKERYEKKEDGLVEKSRDAGATFLGMAFAVWLWIFWQGSKTSFGSRKEQLVDKIGDMDSIFEKGRMMLRNLPKELLPAGYNEQKHATYMKFINPENGASITGESGDNIGRGGRSGLYFKDEAQPLTSNVLTPVGYKSFRDVKLGDVLISPTEYRQVITHINNCGKHNVYKVFFSDGTQVECSENHLWKVNKVIGVNKWEVLPLSKIKENYKYVSPKGQIQYRYRIPVCKSVEFDNNEYLPVDPYIIGALLGDGHMTNAGGSPVITTKNNDIIDQFNKLLPKGAFLSKESDIAYRIVNRLGSGPIPKSQIKFRDLLKDAGVWNMLTENKRIPDKYKYSSIENRLSILQGLMDTDGSGSGGVASFHNTSEQLAKDVIFIVQSLGGTATHNIKPDKRGFKDVHVLHIVLPQGMPCFRVQRKLNSVRKRKHPFGRTITNIEHIGEQEVRCITVNSDDGLYITDNFAVTHNSAFYEHPESIDAALSQNSDVKIDVSTPNGNGNPFYKKRHGGKLPVFVFDWRDDPRKDQAWYDKQKDTLEAWILAQEVDRDYNASVQGICIPAKYVQAAINFKVPVQGAIVAGLDVSDEEGEDSNSLTIREGITVVYREKWNGINTTETARRAYGICNDYFVDMFNYDSIGVGAGIRGEMASLREKIVSEGRYFPVVNGVNVGSTDLPGEYEPGRLDKDMFANLKAALWWRMRRRFERTYEHVNGIKTWPIDELISIPNDPDLISQLSQPLRFINEAGKIQIESKKDLKKRGIPSPDDAESLILSFCNPELIPLDRRGKPEKTYGDLLDDYITGKSDVLPWEIEAQKPGGSKYVNFGD
jgi:hypothetical protein